MHYCINFQNPASRNGLSFDLFVKSREVGFFPYTSPFSHKYRRPNTTTHQPNQPKPTICHSKHHLLLSSMLTFHNLLHLLYLSSPPAPIHQLRNIFHALLLKKIELNLFQNKSSFPVLQNILPLQMFLTLKFPAGATPGSQLNTKSS